METAKQQPPVSIEYVMQLEKQNRILARAGFFLSLLCFLAIGLITWQLRRISRSSTVQAGTKMISANQFTLLDENGKVAGALVGGAEGAMFFLNGPNGKLGLTFGPGPNSTGSYLSLMSPSGEQEVNLNASDPYSWVTVGTSGSAGDKVEMSAGGGIQHVTVSDKAGFEVVLGSTSLIKPQSGRTTNTSAAALTLFGKDGHIIWMAPRL
jgi:hypothetical protein